MFKLTISLFIAIISTLPTNAFASKLTSALVANTVEIVSAQRNHLNKVQEVQSLKKELSFLLNNYALPENFLELSDNDPLIENFRSLNELEGYVDMILFNNKHHRSCLDSKMDLLNASSANDNEIIDSTPQSDELKSSIILQDLICKKSR